MKHILTIFAALLATINVVAQNAEPTAEAAPAKKEIIKTGYNFGPLPAVAFDADKGFQLGALLNIYDFGDGSTYPNTRQQWYFEASFFTKGSQLYVVSYDNRTWIPGVRFSTALTITNDKAMDFYGFNGYQSYYDFQKVLDGKKNDDMYIYTPKYRTNRLAALFKADFVGKIGDTPLSWEAGYHLSYFKQGAINREKINKNKDENKMFPDSEPTLFEQYRTWGIIKDSEADGGLNSTVRVGLLFDTRDKEGAPSRGVWAEAHVMMAPKWLGTTNPYYKYSATFRHYVPIVSKDRLTFAYRLNYEGTFGRKAPYYVLPYMTTVGPTYDRDGMGGFRTVRGIMRNRVQGLDMASYNAELRWRFVQFTLWKQNIAFGLNVFSDGTMVTKGYDMSFGRTLADFATPNEYEKAKAEYTAYMAQGTEKDRPHITVGGGFRFIMNQNFIVCLEYGKPVGKLAKQDGKGAFYINTGYLF
ncbi:MAG: BamA/TamA family outer membrane protein [Rikenellaceae bacterium]|jgi:outer membrane protein assembly factor BamA|nr:BamA/TamA family outer membrane protein [Rikenellaceae bacterium]MBQ5853415.1 BamA/TamA family outer membrane protein [Rikenellaceae bacterium]